MYCYNTIVDNIMLNRNDLEASRKEAQNSSVTLLQELFTHSNTYHFLAEHSRMLIPQANLQLRPGLTRLLISNKTVCFQGHQFGNPEEALEIYKQWLTVVHKEKSPTVPRVYSGRWKFEQH
jgi:hypothetical protein